jgi:hypothetical protein
MQQLSEAIGMCDFINHSQHYHLTLSCEKYFGQYLTIIRYTYIVHELVPWPY